MISVFDFSVRVFTLPSCFRVSSSFSDTFLRVIQVKCIPRVGLSLLATLAHRCDNNSDPPLLTISPILCDNCTCIQAADRGAYICQSQSMNVHMAEASFGKLSSMHFYAWKKGLKTGMYYLRTRPKADAIQFTVDQSSLKVSREKKAEKATVEEQEEEEPECLSCGA